MDVAQDLMGTLLVLCGFFSDGDVCFNLCFVYTCSVFDRGRGIELHQGSTQSVDDYEFFFGLSSYFSLILDVDVLSTQVLQVSNSDGYCVRFHCFAQRKILTVTSIAVLLSLQALLLKLLYCHRLQSHVSQSKEIQSLIVVLWVGYLRWKFKLFSNGWWSNRLCEAEIHTQIVANCVTRLIYVFVERLEQFDILFLDKLVGSVVWIRNCSYADILQLQLGLPNTS